MNLTPVYLVLVLAAAIALVTVSAETLHRRRSHDLVRRWAASNHYEIIDLERRWWRQGPLSSTTVRPQRVYRITVRDGTGAVRSGWIRPGRYRFLRPTNWVDWGLAHESVDVAWDGDRLPVRESVDRTSA